MPVSYHILIPNGSIEPDAWRRAVESTVGVRLREPDPSCRQPDGRSTASIGAAHAELRANGEWVLAFRYLVQRSGTCVVQFNPPYEVHSSESQWHVAAVGLAEALGAIAVDDQFEVLPWVGAWEERWPPR